MAITAKVLVVDTDAEALRLISRALADAGAETKSFQSSVEAAGLIEQEKFDGAILAWSLPQISALQLTQRIRESKYNSRIPIIVLAQPNESEAMAESFKAGVTFFVTKPLTPLKISRLLGVSRGLILEERREYQRAPIAIPTECRHEREEETGISVDLSARGILVDGEKAFAEGANVGLAFSLPDAANTRVEVTGQVARVVQDRRMGIRFTRIKPEERKMIADFVEKTLERMPETIGKIVPLEGERRRSQRVLSVAAVEVAWVTKEGVRVREYVETEVVSAHGALLRTKTRFPISQEVHLRHPDTGESAWARVVGIREPGPNGLVRIAIDVAVPSETFWGVTTPLLPGAPPT